MVCKVRDGEAALLALLAELEHAEDEAKERRAAAASEAAKVEAATAAARKAQFVAETGLRSVLPSPATHAILLQLTA